MSKKSEIAENRDNILKLEKKVEELGKEILNLAKLHEDLDIKELKKAVEALSKNTKKQNDKKSK